MVWTNLRRSIRCLDTYATSITNIVCTQTISNTMPSGAAPAGDGSGSRPLLSLLKV